MNPGQFDEIGDRVVVEGLPRTKRLRMADARVAIGAGASLVRCSTHCSALVCSLSVESNPAGFPFAESRFRVGGSDVPPSNHIRIAINESPGGNVCAREANWPPYSVAPPRTERTIGYPAWRSARTRSSVSPNIPKAIVRVFGERFLSHSCCDRRDLDRGVGWFLSLEERSVGS